MVCSGAALPTGPLIGYRASVSVPIDCDDTTATSGVSLMTFNDLLLPGNNLSSQELNFLGLTFRGNSIANVEPFSS